MALKEHYLMEDWQQMLDEVENIMNTSINALHMAENAEFSSKREVMLKLERSLDTLHALNRKKIDRDISEQATSYLRRHMF
ncbi:hypothetical protein [Oceanobacillus indicireducens]|uniref:Uncharacterized protein n=2 Tax=Oceanobacillus TaxID=182709 RepID=A0A917XZ19_9BACI|nr:hypothetical protein [Oceanobacillus indicireducens]GGN59475.1 hypothetical protein GCM10007971_22650 [Oceanobacillus indicireducens]